LIPLSTLLIFVGEYLYSGMVGERIIAKEYPC
jgi:hypothetical protein